MRRSSKAAWTGLALAAVGLSGCAEMNAPPPLRRVAVVSRCADDRFPVYFQRGSAELQPDSLNVIRSASGRLAGCRVRAVDVLGVAVPETVGGPTDPAMTQRRAQNVARALGAAGLPAPAFDVEVEGLRRMPPRGANEPLPRRAEVLLHAEPAG